MKCITTTTHTYYAVVMNVGGIVNNHLYQLNKVKSSTGDVSWRDDFNCVKFSYGDSFMDLDKLLFEGWKVVMMCAMPSSMAATSGQYSSGSFNTCPPTCLVILEKGE